MKPLPVASTVLKLPRRHEAASNEPWPATLAPGDRSLAGEFERLRECEANLRAYEARLREWQERLDRSDTATPGPAPVAPLAPGRDPATDEAALQAAWQKLYRARELLDAEQNHLRDERMSAHGREAEVQRREKAAEQRERQLAERERLAAEAQAAALAAPPAPRQQASRLGQFTHAPFAFAKIVLSAGK